MAGEHGHHRRRRPERQEGVLGPGLDVDRERGRAGAAGRALDLVRRPTRKCAEALADGRVDAVTTDNVILLGLIAASEGDVRAGGPALHRGALRHRHHEGRRRSSATSSTTCSRRSTPAASGPRPSRRPSARRASRRRSRRRSTATRGRLSWTSSSTTWGPTPNGFRTTVSLTLLSFAGAFVIGCVLASCRVSPVPPLRLAGDHLHRDRPQHAPDRLDAPVLLRVPQGRDRALLPVRLGRDRPGRVHRELRGRGHPGRHQHRVGRSGRGGPRPRPDLRPGARPGRAPPGAADRRRRRSATCSSP